MNRNITAEVRRRMVGPFVRDRRSALARWLVVWLALAPANIARAQIFTDPGFENYAVAEGAFVRPATGPWTFSNDASVVDPFAPNSSNGPLNTWSATFAPIDGEQYASTYAGSDTLRQVVAFNAAGLYRLSVFAAAPSGEVTIPGVGTNTLQDGEFTFTVGNLAIGSPHLVPDGSDWALYTADFAVAVPGNYQLGIRNTRTAPYFINYDAFAVLPVPEPSAIALALSGAVSFILVIRGRRKPMSHPIAFS